MLIMSIEEIVAASSAACSARTIFMVYAELQCFFAD
jgi:hypothetical protein